MPHLKGRRDYYKAGSWAVICDICGFRFHGEELTKQWNNLMVCSTCLEPRHPQDFLKGVKDNKPKPFYRPVGEEVFEEPGTFTPESQSVSLIP